MKPNDILSLLEEAEKLAVSKQGLRASRAGRADSAAEEREPVAPAGAVEPQSAADAIDDQKPAAMSASSAAAAAAAAARSGRIDEAGTKAGDEGVPIGKIDPVKKPASEVKAASDDGGVKELTANWADQVPTGHGKIVSKGMLFVFGFLALFVGWAVAFPISSAVVAGGKVISNGKNKLVQHPDGGVVREIFVSDGQVVQQGDLLMVLDRSAKQAELTRLLARRQTLEARKMRYEAEQRGEQLVAPSQNNAAGDDTLTNLRGDNASDAANAAEEAAKLEANAVLEEQLREFDAARKRLEAQVESLNAKIESLKEEQTGLRARLEGGERLLTLTERELARVRPLANDGYLPKSRLWDLEKTQLEQQTAGQNIRAEIQAAEQRIAETRSQLNELLENDRQQRSEEMTKIIGELAEISDQVPAAQIALDLTELRAPASGTIVNLTANTTGGVIPAGEPIAEIVPEGAELEVEFRVPLNKAKQVFEGQKARVTITTFNRRTYDPLDGEVTFVSADSLTDQQTGESYFLARAKMMDTPGKQTGFTEVRSGMAAEVYVLATPRVFAEYVLQPLIDSFNRAFREI